MTDTEMLNLIEHYRWELYPIGTDRWIIFGIEAKKELSRTTGLRAAIKLAMAKKAELAMGGTQP